MTTIAQALTSLGITEWVLRGEPTNEEEFNQMFRKVTGADRMVQLSKVQTQRTGELLGKKYLLRKQS